MTDRLREQVVNSQQNRINFLEEAVNRTEQENRRLLEDIERYREDIQRLREQLQLTTFPPIALGPNYSQQKNPAQGFHNPYMMTGVKYD